LGFSPFMAFAAGALTLKGATAQSFATSIKGAKATRNFCPNCHSMVYGGLACIDLVSNTYAGTLDEPARFAPKIAIMTQGRPDWALIRNGLRIFAKMPG
jgi:hypothetical protein